MAGTEVTADGQRRKSLRRIAPLLGRVFAAALWLGSSAPSQAHEKLRVVTTTTDLKSLAEAVGGDRVDAINLVPPSIDAEEYQAKPQDVLRLKDARMVVRVGLDFDLWFDRLLAQGTLTQTGMRGIRRGEPGYVDASAAIAVLDARGMSVGPSDGHAHGSGNPHYWLDPKNAEIVTGNILAALAQIDPANGAAYEANRLNFLARLDAKLAEWQSQLASWHAMPLIAYHNSWAYLARRFRLNIIGFVEPKPGVPPSPAHLAQLIRLMRDSEARAVIRQPHEPEKNAAFVAGKAGAATVVLAGSVGALPGATDYLALFDTNVAALKAVAP